MSDESKNKQKTIKRNKKGYFLKGESGNPGGTPKELLDLRPFILKNRYLVTKKIHETANLTLDELTAIFTKKDCSAMEAVIARLYSKAVAGSLPHAALILDRVLGKIPNIEPNGLEDAQPSELESFSVTVLANLMLRLKAEAQVLEKIAIPVQG